MGKLAAPKSEFDQKRFGPMVPETSIALMEKTSAALMAAYGVPGALLCRWCGGRAGHSASPSLFLDAVLPLARSIEAELSLKLEDAVRYRLRRSRVQRLVSTQPRSQELDGAWVLQRRDLDDVGHRRTEALITVTVTVTLGELAQAVRITASGEPVTSDYQTILQRQLAAATATVEAYAPNAPDDVANEAVVLLVGHLLDSPIAHRAPSNSFINSGARSLLSRWHEVG